MCMEFPGAASSIKLGCGTFPKQPASETLHAVISDASSIFVHCCPLSSRPESATIPVENHWHCQWQDGWRLRKYITLLNRAVAQQRHTARSDRHQVIALHTRLNSSHCSCHSLRTFCPTIATTWKGADKPRCLLLCVSYCVEAAQVSYSYANEDRSASSSPASCASRFDN